MKTQAVSIRRGLSLYKQPLGQGRGSPNWYTRVYMPLEGRTTHVRSTGTTDLRQAKHLAEQFWAECLLKQRFGEEADGKGRGGTSVTYRFDLVADAWLNGLLADAGSDGRRLRAYDDARKLCTAPNGLSAFFGRTSIGQISTSMIREYLRFAASRSKKGALASTTQRNHLTTLRSILKFAYEQGMITALPLMPKVKLVDRPRSWFDAMEYRVLTRSAAILSRHATLAGNDKAAAAVETVTDAESNRTTYEYDAHQRLLRTRFPHPSTDNTSSTSDYEELTYELIGGTRPSPLVANRQLRDGQHISFAYDALSRLTTINRPETAWGEYDSSFGYDLLSRLTSAASGNGQTLTYSYDALGRRLSEYSNFYGTIAASQFDAAGRRTRLTWRDGFYVTYDYNVTGEMTAIRENGASSGVGVLATFAYDDRGRRTSLTRGNGTGTTYSYDNISRLSQLSNDLVTVGSDLTLTLGHNPASQIVSRSGLHGLYTFGYTNQNVTNTINGLNQVTATGSTSIGHDGRGNVNSIGSSYYAYTGDNRLASAAGSNYAYDPAGRLYYQSAGDQAFHYDGHTLIMETGHSSNTILRRYVHGPGVDEPLVWYEGSGTSDRRWLHADERGSIVALSNGSGNAITYNAYDEYGVPKGPSGVGTLYGRFGYTGQAWLSENAIYYYRARMYNPSIGRFMQTDPIEYVAGMNLYAYVGNDPLNLRDPLGLVGETPVFRGEDRTYRYSGGPRLSWPSGSGAYGNRWAADAARRRREEKVELCRQDPNQCIVVTGRRPSPDSPALPSPMLDRPYLRLAAPSRQDFCGAGNSSWVPDNVMGSDLSYPCARHDACYSTPGASKQVCDLRLGLEVYGACLAAGNQAGFCLILGVTYFNGVTVGGQGPYNDAQRAARRARTR